MRVVFVSPTGAVGGAEACLLDLLAVLRADRPGWPLTLLLGDDGPLRGAATDLGVTASVLPIPARLAVLGDSGQALGALAVRGPGAAAASSAYLARLRGVLAALAPDLVQTNGMKAHVLGAWGAPRGVPVVWHLHDYAGSRPVMARLLRWPARRRVRAVAVSRSVADDAARVLGPRVPVETVYNAVDLSRFAPGAGDPARLDALAGLPPAPPGVVRVGLVATYARWKGHEVFLDAVARLTGDPPVRAYVVGGPIYRSAGSQFAPGELRSRADALGLAGRVGFVPHQAAPEWAYRSLDVVVHASTRPEPFGRVIAEALACGRAVVAAGAGGAAELFEPGVTAMGCPPGDPAALAATLARLAADPGLRRALGSAGRDSAVRRFDRARLTGEWLRVYDAAGVKDGGGPRAPRPQGSGVVA